MSDGLRRAAALGWAARERLGREGALRFERLATAIARFDAASPVTGLLRRAADDARRHADLCGELRAAYGGEPPGEVRDRPLAPPALGARPGALYELVAASCIAETGHVAEVAALLAGPAEAEVRVVLHEIARDLVSHSRMGWAHLSREAAAGDVAFLGRWIPAMLNAAAGPELFSPEPEPAEAAELPRLGLLPLARRRELFVRTVEDVVFTGLERFGVATGPARAWLAARATPAGAP